MTPSSASEPHRSTAVRNAAAVAATAAVTALTCWGIAASTASATTGDEQSVAVWSPTDGSAGGAAIVPVAIPTTTCAGSYLSTQPAGAAAPAVRTTAPAGP